MGQGGVIIIIIIPSYSVDIRRAFFFHFPLIENIRVLGLD